MELDAYFFSDSYTSAVWAAHDLEQLCRLEGGTLNLTFGHNQRFELERLLREKSDSDAIFIVYPRDPDDVAAAVHFAGSNSSAVIFLGTDPGGRAADYPAAWYIGTEGRDAGAALYDLIANYLKEVPNWDLNGNGRLDLVVLRDKADSQEESALLKTLKARLKKAALSYSQLYDAVPAAEVSRRQAGHDLLSEYVRDHADESIELVLCLNDELAVGAVQALQEPGWGGAAPEPRAGVFAVGASRQVLELVAQGTIQGAVLQDAHKIAVTALALAHLIAAGIPEDSYSASLGVPVKQRRISLPHLKITAKLAPYLLNLPAIPQ